MKEMFLVSGMTCSACSAHVEKAVKQTAGVEQVTVSLLQNAMTVEYDPQKVQPDQIVQAVEKAGYGAARQNTSSASEETSASAKTQAAKEAGREFRQTRLRLIGSICFLIPLMYVSMGHMMGLPMPAFFHGTQNALIPAFTQFLLTLPILYLNRSFFIRGAKSLVRRAPTMDALIAIGAGAAVLYGVAAIYAIGWGLGHGRTEIVTQFSMDLYFESAGTILTLITVGKMLEARSKGRTTDAIARLMDLSPKMATVLKEGRETVIPVEQVRPGDILVVKAGEYVPVDGVLTEGTGALDEAALTGESLPVEKNPGDRVMTASVNTSGWFQMQAEKVGGDTTLAQIIHLVEEAGASKAPIAQLADKISGVFVPVVISIAAATILIWLLLGESFAHALSMGIAVLVISCPCALGLATPTAIMVGTGKGAEHGVLIKSAESLETARAVNTVVLDKTGTVTAGKPAVTGIYPAEGTTEQQLLTVAASLEQRSEHPLAVAILAKAAQEKLTLTPPESYEAIPGQGISGKILEKSFLAGNLKMMQANHIDVTSAEVLAERLAEQGETPLYFAGQGRFIGLISLADTLKATSVQAVEELQHMGVSVVLLTGDNRRTAQAIGRKLNLPEQQVISEVLPQDKEAVIRKLQEEGKKVAMVGDGVNDAPALVRADVGMAIGAGTDIAMDSADVVLMKSDLLDAVAAIQLSRATLRNIKQNLFWAFFYNALGIPLAAGVFYSLLNWRLSPMFAAAAMSLSSVCVVSNALRLKLWKPKYHRQHGDFSSRTSGDSEKAETFSVSISPEQPSTDAQTKILTEENPQKPASVDSALEKSKPSETKKDGASDFHDTFPVLSQNQEVIISQEQQVKDGQKRKGEMIFMTKTLKIQGMSCGHCQAHVEKALNALEGVSAQVSLEENSAVVTLSKDVADDALVKAVVDAGYEVTAIA